MGNVTPPPGGLVGNSNYFIHSNGDPITDLIVSLQITEAIDSVIGVGFQLNCWGKGDDPTKWQQYILYFSKPNNSQPTIYWQIDNWPSPELANSLKITGDLINQWSPSPLVTLSEDQPQIPSPYTISIVLTTDPETHNVISVDFFVDDDRSYAINSGPIHLINQPVSGGTPEQKITANELSPIYAVQMNIVGPDGGGITMLYSGAGNITYTATSELYVMREQPTWASYQGGHTEEQSNAAYGELPPGPSSSIVQPFTTPRPFWPGGSLAATQRHGANETDVFAVGANGRPHLFSVQGGGNWTGPTPIGPTDVAGVVALLAVSEQFGAGDQTDLFLVGLNGQLQVYWAKSTGGYHGPVGVGPTDLFLPGGLAASQQFGCNNQTDVFLVDKNGRLVVFWVQGAGAWSGALAISSPGFASPSASVAVSQQFGCNNQTDVFVVDKDGRLNVFWVQGAGAWAGPLAISAAGFAPPESSLTACQQFGCNNQTDVFLIDNAGRLNVFWVEGAGEWNGPVQISAAGLGWPGGTVVAMEQLGCNNQTDVLFNDVNGQISLFWTENAGPWNGPVKLLPGTAVPPGSGLAVSPQFGVTNQTDIFFLNNAGQPGVQWVVAAGAWQGTLSLYTQFN
ncbi:MAG: hypothetical protein WA742_18300 [Candidatus Cybelea sp.]